MPPAIVTIDTRRARRAGAGERARAPSRAADATAEGRAPLDGGGRARAVEWRLLAAWLLILLGGYGLGVLVTGLHLGADLDIVRALGPPAGGALSSSARVITAFGSTPVLDAVFAVALVALLIARRRREALLLVLASPGGTLLVELLKGAVRRPRPPLHHLTRAEGFSFPSGHAGSSLALYGALALIVGAGAWGLEGRARAMRRTGAVSVVALVALVGVSRVMLGVHYLSDVLASWALVGAWLLVLRRTLGPERRGARAG